MGLWDLISIIPNAFKTVDNVTNAIRDLQLAKVQAGTEKEKAAIQERIDQLHEIRLANESDNNAVNKLNQIARFVLFGLPASLVIWKLLVFDKVIGSLVKCSGPVAPMLVDSCKVFRTDSLDPNMWWVIIAAAGFYLVTTRK
jgi:hypothetical protein